MNILTLIPKDSSTKPDFSGYYVYITFTQILFGSSLSGKIRCEINTDGKAEFDLPPYDQIQSSEIFIEAYSPFGNIVSERQTVRISSGNKNTIELRVNVEISEIFNTKIPQYIISGKLIDLSECIDFNDLQYIIFGTNSSEAINFENAYILAHGKSSKEGYFLSEIPNEPIFEKYLILFENDETKFYELRTIKLSNNLENESTEINRIADKQIIALEISGHEDDKITTDGKKSSQKDCGCGSKGELNSSGLSKENNGNCVSFTSPNRTIDEFSFYHVVRTTEPEIKSTFLTSKTVLEIYEDLDKTLNVIPAKLISPKVVFELPVFKTETQFKASIQRVANSSVSGRAALRTSPLTAASLSRTMVPMKSSKINLDDFKALDGIKFTDLFESKKIEAKSDFDARKKALEQEEQNIRNLIENVSRSLITLRENPDAIESNLSINELIYRVEIIRTAIKNYIISCEEFKRYFSDELISKILGTSEVNYISELNKTIKEFQVFEKSIDAKIKQLAKMYGERNTGRRHVTVENEIDWDNTPTVYHNTTVAHGHILHFKQIWKNDGYSIGKVLQSIPLMPGQQKNIAVLEWNRTNISSRVEEQTTSEQLANSMSRDRDVSEVMNSAFSENIRASSQVKSKTSGWSVGASVGFPIGPVMVGISGGYSSSKSSASSTATQDANRNLSASSMNKLRDNIQQSASSLRSQRSTVVQTVSQNESFSISTEVIANYNHCHALTMQYFEILRHILIESKLVDVQECLFFPLPMSEFTTDKILRWKNTLSGVLLENDLMKGLNAVDRIESEYQFVDFPAGRYADEEIDFIDGELSISFSFTRPLDQIDEDGKERLDTLESIISTHPFFGVRGIFNSLISNYRQIELVRQKERDAVFETEIVPKIVEALTDCLVISRQGGDDIPGFDFTLVDSYESKRITGWDAIFKYANQGRISEISSKNKPLRFKFRSTSTLGIKRSDLTGLQIRFDLSKLGGSSVLATTPDHKILLHSFKANYSTHHYEGLLTAQYGIKDDLGLTTLDSALVRTPLNSLEKRNPRDEDQILAAKLINHLNEYLEFYHKQIWLSMDPNRLFSLVDGYIAPNSGGRSVASVCENQIIGVVGNNLVLKVASGYKLDPTYRLEDGATLLEHYQPTTPADPFHISFPTSGIYAEAVMGACNSCEKIDDTRYWKWEEHPIPNKPTEIQPISTDSRYVDPGNLQTKDLATPMINIQNAPEAPAPTGLGGVFDLMGKSGIFSDMTGLAGNQDIVKEALKVNAEQLKNTQANAVEGMKVAKQIYDSQQANRDSQRKMEAIDQAFPPDGTPEQQKENARLKSALLNKQIGNEEEKKNPVIEGFKQRVKTIDEMVKDKIISPELGREMKEKEIKRFNENVEKPTVSSVDGIKDISKTASIDRTNIELSSDGDLKVASLENTNSNYSDDSYIEDRTDDSTEYLNDNDKNNLSEGSSIFPNSNSISKIIESLNKIS